MPDQQNAVTDLGEGELSTELTPEQRERLHRVRQRIEGSDDINPNLADTRERAAEHGFVWKRTPFGS